ELSERYDELGLRAFRGGINEEPLYATALAIHRVPPVDDGGRGMRTPLRMRGWLHVDVLGGSCRFRKEGVPVEPTIVHFAGPYAAARDPRSAFYRRERDKLESAARGRTGPGPAATVRYALACVVGCVAI